MRKFLLLGACVLLFGCDVPLSVEGTVNDPSNQPVAGAEITLRSKSGVERWSIASDDLGKFKRHATGSGGDYVLSIEKEGYNRYEHEFNNDGSTVTVDAVIEPLQSVE